MVKRLSWRVQPVEQIRKRKQRKREMWERHQQFAEYVERVKRKKGNSCDIPDNGYDCENGRYEWLGMKHKKQEG
jgi:hypothetical protein